MPEDDEGPSSPRTPLTETTKPTRSLALVVLAAGKGKRLKSASQKVLHPICGRPALWHALRTGLTAKPTRIVIVVGHGGDEVRAAVESWDLKPAPVFVEQAEQLGTGHAVLVAEAAVGRVSDVLIANGDFDPVRPDDVRRLLRLHRRSASAASVLTTELDEPGRYARVVRAGSRIERVIEDQTSAAERAIREVATNWIAFRRDDLYRALPLVGRENRQGEHYINDAYPILMEKGELVSALTADTGGAMGVNSRGGLAAVERVVRERINAGHLANGVTLVDPATTYIDVDVRIGRDTVILPLTFLEGVTRVGTGCRIGPSTRVLDTRIGNESEVSFSVVEHSKLGAEVTVGPFARLRPGTVLERGSLIGNFVEVKSARLGPGSKAKHLTYLGNVEIGRDVNVGAGTVVVNYDGYEKHTTVIGDGARIGSDTMLVAPVRVGKNANTGAGSVITKDVPSGALAVERNEQRIVPGYRKRKDDEHRGKRKRR
jgi:bifunctional UDP-N-acetylglucosamine pyrophosphorylase / glucosamine-1-phosphate N-acetyltransferase